MILAYGGQESWDTVCAEDAAQGETWPQEHVDALNRHLEALNSELIESGELILGAGLADPTHTKTVRAHGDDLLITDGPYLEAKEFLAGWWVVDVASERRAAEIAAHISRSPSPDGPVRARVEIRPVEGTAS